MVGFQRTIGVEMNPGNIGGVRTRMAPCGQCYANVSLAGSRLGHLPLCRRGWCHILTDFRQSGLWFLLSLRTPVAAGSLCAGPLHPERCRHPPLDRAGHNGHPSSVVPITHRPGSTNWKARSEFSSPASSPAVRVLEGRELDPGAAGVRDQIPHGRVLHCR